MNQKFGLKPFNFVKGWMKHHSFKSILKDNWEATERANPMFCPSKKLKKLKDPIKKLSKEKFVKIRSRVEKARLKIEEAQTELIKDLYDIQL